MKNTLRFFVSCHQSSGWRILHFLTIPMTCLAFPLLAAPPAGLEEIVVTSERRTESLQDIAASVTAFTGARLEAANVQDVRGYFFQTPNVTFQEEGRSGPRSVDIAIRGVSNIGGEVNAFGVYLDGFNIANVAQEGAVNPALVDVERIEVLRGPQGTFFGRNATGGALNIISNQPGPEFEGRLSGHYGRYNTWGLAGILNIPVISDKLFLRTMLNYEESDGFVKNVNPAGGSSDFQLANMKLALRWLATERLTVDVTGYAMREDSGISPLLPTGVLDVDTMDIVGTSVPVSDGLPFFPNNKTMVNHDQPLDQQNDTDIGNLRLAYVGDGFQVHSITGIIKTKRDYMDELDFTSQPLLTQEIHDRAKSWSEELRIQSDDDGPIKWTFGGLYAEDEKDIFHAVRAGTGGFFGLPDQFPIDVVAEHTKTKSWALFGQATWQMLDRLDLTVGGRYSRDKVAETAAGIGFGNPKPNYHGESSFSDFSPRVSASYDWNDDVTTYVTISKGYKAGGLQFNADLPTESFDEEKLWNYELGFRSYLLDRRVMFNTTLFYMDWTDLQVSSFETLTNPNTGEIRLITSTKNAASASSKGIEVEIAAQPTAQIYLDGSIGYLDAKFDDFPDANITGARVDLSGVQLIRAPKWTLNFNAQYDFPIAMTASGELDAFLRGEWSYRSRTKPNIEAIIHEGFPNDIPSFQVVNFRAGVTSESWRVEAFVENAFKENYFTGHSNFGFGGIRVRPHPRIWGLRFAVNFN